MKKTKKMLSIILTVVMILSTISVSASAAIMGPCGACHGTGSVAVTCEECGGDGCPLCGGEGSIYEKCDICDGTGKLELKPIPPEDPEPTEPALDFVIDDDDVVVEYIGEGGDVVIPDGVKAIGRNAFESCYNIVSVTIPSTVTAIGDEAFIDCRNLKDVYVSWTDEVPEIEYNVFCRRLDVDAFVFLKGAKLHYPDGTKDLYENTKGWEQFFVEYDEFEIDEDGVLYGYNGKGGDVVIPDGVTAISDEVFLMNNSITSVVIPEGVTSIGNGAFAVCPNLTSVTLPAGLTSIGVAAFEVCSALESIAIPESVTEIGIEAFFACESLKDVYVSWTDEIPGISEDAFAYVLDEEREVLGWTSAELHVPEGTEEAYENTECWFFFYLPKFNDPDFVINMFGFLIAYNGDGGDVVIPDGVVAIGNNVFDEGMRLFPGVTSVKIPDTVFEIGDNAFCSCYGLETVTIPESVYRIGYNAFASCGNLESVTLPARIDIIEDTAFSDCDSLKTVYYHCNTTKENIEDFMFSFGDFDYVQLDHNFVDGECTYCGIACDHNGQTSGVCEICGRNLADDFVIDENGVLVKYNGTGSDVVVPDGVTAIGEMAFYNTKVKNVVIPEGVTSLDDSAFAYCSSLESVTLPESLKTIGDNAFNYCEYVDLKIPAGVTSIGVQAFNHCRCIKEITVPDGVTELKEMAFAGCAGITSLVIPDSVTKIGEASVFSCGGIKELTISGNVASIDAEAFRGSGSIENIYFNRAEDVFAISDDTFDADVYENATLHVPEGTKALYEAADGWSNFVNIVDDIKVVSPLDAAKAAAIAELEAAAREDATGVTAAKLEEAIAAINAAESLDEIEAAETAGAEALDAIPAGDIKESICEPSADGNKSVSAAIENHAIKIQIVDKDGNTVTLTRDNPKVSIQAYDADGNPVSELDRTAAYEVWNVSNQFLKEGEYTIIAKNSDGEWDSLEDGCKIKIENSRTYVDVVEILPSVVAVKCSEKFNVRVVTGRDILKVTIQCNGVDYKTFTPSGKDDNGNNVFDCFVASNKYGDAKITVKYKTADGWFDCTDVSATVSTGSETIPAL